MIVKVPALYFSSFDFVAQCMGLRAAIFMQIFAQRSEFVTMNYNCSLRCVTVSKHSRQSRLVSEAIVDRSLELRYLGV